jgi:hypothetical protein
MFSANENLVLRQHKRRIVQRIERTIPEEALEMGTTVMVMQVSCKAPGCVPLETAIIIVFPKQPSNNNSNDDTVKEWIPGLVESRTTGTGAGSYKTKILKPMAEVTDDDILDALPPAFEGGRRTMEKLCIQARDVMIGQITQLFGGGDDDDDDDDDEDQKKDRKAMATYLQSCLQEYMDGGCKPPKPGQPFPSRTTTNQSTNEPPQEQTTISTTVTTTMTTTNAKTTLPFPSTGNVVIRRVMDDDNHDRAASTTTAMTKTATATAAPPKTVVSIRGQPPLKHQQAIYQALYAQQTGSSSTSTSNNNHDISQLFNREHAPGIRQAGCPCCDPDNPSTIVDKMMMMM